MQRRNENVGNEQEDYNGDQIDQSHTHGQQEIAGAEERCVAQCTEGGTVELGQEGEHPGDHRAPDEQT